MKNLIATVFVVFAASVLSTSAAFGGGCGDPGAGSCYESNGTPFCDDAVCCETVCAVDPSCCSDIWDSFCGFQAKLFCDDYICGGANNGSCYDAHPTSGCDNAECCQAVCLANGNCCENDWELYCVELALKLCGPLSCGDPEAGNCYENNDTPFCEDTVCCEAVCAVDPSCCNDGWDHFCGFVAEIFCEDLICGGENNGSCYEVQTSPGCDNAECCQAVCLANGNCCENDWELYCVELALQLCVSLSCGHPEAGSCFEPNGTPGCDDAECCGTVCDMDPYCCDSNWDGICVDEAQEFCAGCGTEPAGSCFEINGTPGCEYAECCATVCDLDPFCCETTWDEYCVDEAQVFCAGCGSAEAGSCYEDNGTSGCDNSACCTVVCDADPFCCEDVWDSYCADAAIILCPIWDNDLVPDGVSGRGISPPSFPDYRVVDDFVIPAGEEWIIQGFHINAVEDVNWTDGGVAEIYIYDDNDNSPGNLIISISGLPFTKIKTGDILFELVDFDYSIVDLDIPLSQGRYWIGLRFPNGGGTGTNYWMTSTGQPDGPDTSGWYSSNAGQTWILEGNPDWDHAFTITGIIADSCPWDLDGSGAVGTSDLLALFSQWGTDGPADFDGDGVVNTTDLLTLFANWGPCP